MIRKTALFAAIAMSCAAFAGADTQTFDLASIKPSAAGQPLRCDMLPGGRFECHNVRLEFLLRLALNLRSTSILKGAPAWLDELYNIDAVAEGAGEMTQAQLAPYLLALFQDRFGLMTHEEPIQETVYILEQQKSGAKVQPSAPGTEYSSKPTDESVLLQGETMAAFANVLAGRPDVNARVIDNTGLEGKFDFAVPYVNLGGNAPPAAATPEAVKRTAASYSSTFDAVLAIGLRLRQERRDGTAVVIDQLHRPTEN